MGLLICEFELARLTLQSAYDLRVTEMASGKGIVKAIRPLALVLAGYIDYLIFSKSAILACMTNSVHKQVIAISIVLILFSAGAILTGGLGVVNYLDGDMLRAATSLGIPVYLAYWAWRERGADLNPLIPILAAAWVVGLPMGLATHWLSQVLA